MTGAEWAAVLTAIAAPLGVIAAFLRFYISRIDKLRAGELAQRNTDRTNEIARQDELREELRIAMEARIAGCELTIKTQTETIRGLMTHIRKLEYEMAKAGLTFPPFDFSEIVGGLR